MALPLSSSPQPSSIRLYLGIDLGKYEHCISYDIEKVQQGERRIIHAKIDHIGNNASGFAKLNRRIRSYRPDECYALLEKTGHYGDSLIEFLTAQGMTLYAIQIQERELEDKTDENDARYLSEMVYQQVGLGIKPMKRELRIHPLLPPTETAKQLRGLAQRHCELVRELTRTKNRLRELQNRIFPEFCQAIHDPNCPTALRIRERFPTPASLAGAPIADLFACRLPKARSPSNKTLLALQQFAQTSIGVKNQPEICLEQSQLIETLSLLEKQIDTLEGAMFPVVLASREGKILMSLPMISPTWAAYLIASIGTIANFSSASKLCAYSGWIPNRRQTGKTHDSTKFSRAGNRLLKNALYFITLQAVKQRTVWRDIYLPLVERICPYNARLKKRVHKMRAIVRIGNQILRLVYLLLRKDYDMRRSLPEGAPVPEPVLYDPIYHKTRQTSS